MKSILSTAAALIVTSIGPVLAGIKPVPVAAPEISALDGAAALAVVAAIVLLVWERRRAA